MSLSAKSQLSEADWNSAASMLGVDVPTIMAVAEVESPGGGFLPSGEPFILFEAHVFSRLTRHQYDSSHPAISSRRWNRGLYRRAQLEHARLAAAVALDRDAALQSASWGCFQIIGENWRRCGFRSLQAFVNAMYRGEPEHLQAFCHLVVSMGLTDELQREDWDGFARIYNGPDYATHNYAGRMALAHHAFSTAAA
jgi:hypothetical protein